MSYKGVESVVQGTSSDCLKAIFDIHFPDSTTVADLTYGKGRFWQWKHNRDIIGFDAEAYGGAIVEAHYNHVPLANKSVDVAVFDPPFIFSAGLYGKVGAKRWFLGAKEAEQRFYGGADNKELRILAPRNADELHIHTIAAVAEMVRIARYGMILKGQDLITGKHPNWWTYRTMRGIARNYDTGRQDVYEQLLPEDMLIQVSKAARIIDPRWKNQFHFRRRHAVYLIYKWGD